MAAFRGIYGPWERPGATISGLRGVRVGGKRGLTGGSAVVELSGVVAFCLHVREVSNQEAGEVACDYRVTAVSGGAAECLAGVRPAGLDHC